MTSKQRPLGSGFGASSTATDVVKDVDLSGRHAIVTGGYSGLGRETARVLASAGARVLVPARDPAKAAAALGDFAGVEIEAMDLLNPVSVDRFAAKYVESGRPLHILVNSAGIMASPLFRDARGYEGQFATNHLGHFQLTARLYPALLRAKGSRVVSVSSWAHHYSPVVLDDVNFDHRDYNRWTAYGQSKTANILFAVALDQLGRSDGVRAFSLHPGSIVDTGLQKHLSLDELRGFGAIDDAGSPVRDPGRNLKTIEQGASTSVWCSVSHRLDGVGGVYCENNDIAPLDTAGKSDWQAGDSGRYPGVMPYAVDPQSAQTLWDLSEALTGIRFR